MSSLRTIGLIARRELAASLKSPLGPIVIAVALLIDGLWFYGFGLGDGKRLSAEVLFRFFEGASGTTMIAAVVLSMRLLAGERETGTFVLLNTAPIRDRDIVLGKFLAAFAVIALLTLLTAYMPLLVFVNGRVAIGHIAIGYAGILLLGSASLSIGLFASALAKNQVLAVILAAAFVATLVLLWQVAKVSSPPLSDYIEMLSLHHLRQRPFLSGKLELEHVVFYLSITYFFLLAAQKTLEARRWR